MPLQGVKEGLSDEDMGFGATASPSADLGLSDEEMGFSGNASKKRASAVREVRPRVIPNGDEEQGLKPGSLSGSTGRSGIAAIMDALGGSSDAAAKNTVDTATLGNLRYNKRFASDLDSENKDFPKSATAGKLAGMAGLASAASALPANVGAQVAASGAQGFAEKPAGDDFNAGGRLNNAKNSAILSGLMAGGGKLSGKVGDWLMQKAAGAGDYIPGMGARMADEGLVGTKGMMKGQVATAMPGAIAETNTAAAQIPGKFSPHDSAKAVSDYIKSKLPNANLPAGSMPQNVEEASEGAKRLWGIVGRPDLSGPDTLDAARKIGSQAYREGDPTAGIKAALNRIDAGTMKSQLKSASEGVKSGLAREETLQTAKNALSQPYSIADLGRTVAKGTGIAGAAGLYGYAHGGAEESKADAAAAALLSAIGSTSLAKSAGARGMISAGKNSPALSALLNDYLAKKNRGQK